MPGLFFYGNHNFETYKVWGNGTRVNGLADTFAGGYGPISYLIMAIADYLGSFNPSVWWWPYKGANLIFEILILYLFIKLFPKEKIEVTLLYWLNPWFLIPGAWQGFWDAAFGFFVLLTVFIMDEIKKGNKYRFYLGGIIFSLAGLIKPQIIAPISILVLIFLLKHFFKLKFREFFMFCLGFLMIPVLFNLYFFLHAKGLFFLWVAYKSFMNYMPYLVNSEINIWHTLTRIIMGMNNIPGPIYSLSTLTFPYNLIEKAAQIAYFILLLLYVLKSKIDQEKHYFLKAFTFAFILMPQILTRSHAYHFYPAALLTVPLIVISKSKTLFLLWSLNVFAHFYNIYWQYGMGNAIGHITRPPGEPYLSLMGIIAFVSTIGLIKIFLAPKLA